MASDFRFALRMLRRSPGVTAAAILALALGIGANTAIFSVVDHVLLRPLPYPDSGELVAVWRTAATFGFGKSPFSWPDFKDLRAQNQVFEEVGVWANGDVNLSGGGSVAERVLIHMVSPSLLPTLRVSPVFGRNFTEEETHKGSDHVVMLDWSLAQRRFGSAESAVGQSVRLDGVDYQVIGVLPRGFQFESPADVWMPTSTSLEFLEIRNAHFLNVLARRKPGVTKARIDADLASFSKSLTDNHADIYPTSMGLGTRYTPYLEEVVGDVKLPLLVLLGAVGFVLLIACANVANLLLARAATRHREMAIRAALGAGRGRLVRQLLTESLLLSFAGAALGLAFAAWGVDALVALAPDAPRVSSVTLDGRVLLFTIGVALVTGIAFGLAPALAASRPDMHDALKDGTRGTTAGRGRLRKTLVVTEVALSLVLLVGTGLMVRSFIRLRNVDPGFRADHALSVSISLPVADSKVTDADRQRFIRFFGDVGARLSQLPGVTAVGGVNIMPLTHNSTDRWIDLEGYTPHDASEKPDCEMRMVTGDWFGAMGIPIVRGRGFLPSDTERSARVVVVNQAWVKRWSADRDPIGRRLRLPSVKEPDGPWSEIVGVIGDVRGYGLDHPTRTEIYWPHKQLPESSLMTMVVRTSGDPSALAGSVRNAIAEVDGQQPIFDLRTLEALVSTSLAQRRFTLTLMLLFGAIALVLAAVGIYGVMAYTVAQRTQEIGIRVALGATTATVMRMVLRDGMTLVAVGLAIGGVASLVLTRLGAALLWGISAADAGTYVVLATLLAAVALVAILIPARRATRIDPMQALRSE